MGLNLLASNWFKPVLENHKKSKDSKSYFYMIFFCPLHFLFIAFPLCIYFFWENAEKTFSGWAFSLFLGPSFLLPPQPSSANHFLLFPPRPHLSSSPLLLLSSAAASPSLTERCHGGGGAPWPARAPSLHISAWRASPGTLGPVFPTISSRRRRHFLPVPPLFRHD